MKSWIIALACLPVLIIGACKSSTKSPPTFCDTACLNDSIKFTGTHKLRPYVYISAMHCVADSITWSYSGMGINRKTGFSYLLNKTVKLNKEYIRCEIIDTAYAWVLFNDCATGRGYQLKLPFNKTKDIGRKSSGINNLDKKFIIDNNLVAYTDRGNIWVEDMATGKTAMMTFGKATDMDYDAIHETLDSVNITTNRIWVKVKIDDKWQELEKKIELK